MQFKHHHQFLLEKEQGKQDCKLRFRIKYDNNRRIVNFNPGFRIETDKWSIETQRCKTNTTHGKKKIPASIINRELQRYENATETTFFYFEKQNVIPDIADFKEIFTQNIGRYTEKHASLLDNFDTFLLSESLENQWTEATIKKMNTVKRNLQLFDSNLTYERLNDAGLNDYISFLRQTLEYRNRTASKHLNLLKWFLRWAVKHGYNKNLAFQTFSPRLKIEDKKVIFLEWNELMMLYNFPIPSNRRSLEHVRDVFCFCCFTSLRYSDVANLRRSDVHDGYISITTVKTADSLKIELNDYSSAILAKYKNEQFSSNRALPVIANQKMNEHLKELGKLSGLDTPVTITYYRGNERIDMVYPKYELLSTHAARRTFICNALMLGIPPEIVMKWTGHSNYNAMKPYIAVADNAKADAMTLFNKKVPNPQNQGLKASHSNELYST